MGEEAFYETVLASDTGTVYVRGGYGREEVYLGMTEGNTPDAPDPDYMITLTPRQQHGLLHAIEACRWVIEWRSSGPGKQGLEWELLDDEDQPILLLTVEPIVEPDDMLSRFRCSVWAQDKPSLSSPLYRVTTEDLKTAKRALEDWWLLHSFEYGG